MAVSEEIDLELIAAFIDGRLAGAERDRVVKLLGESDVAFEIYADAIRTRTDLGDAPVASLAAHRERRRSRWLVAVPAAAAAVLLLAVLPTIQARRDNATLGLATTAIASPLTERSDLASALRPGWDDRRWSVMRGGASARDDSVAEFRLGVRATDLQIALSAGDRDRARLLTAGIVDLLQPVQLSDDVKVEYAELGSQIEKGETREQLATRALRAEQMMAELLDSRSFSFGKWFAAGELAARLHSAPFFASGATSRFLSAAIAHGRLAPGDVDLLRQVVELTKKGVSDDEFDQIQEKFAELIRRHGG